MIAVVSRYREDTDDVLSEMVWRPESLEYVLNDKEHPKGYVMLNHGWYLPEDEERLGTYTKIQIYADATMDNRLYFFEITKNGIIQIGVNPKGRIDHGER